MQVQATKRSDYKYFHAITTRWMDNDAYGHVNNVIYYSWFDTVVNQFLIANDVLDIESSPIIGLVVETQCNYFAPLTFPDRITAGISVTKLGNSSVGYEVGIFKGEEITASAQGRFIHVYVSRVTRRPIAIPDKMRAVLQTIRMY